MNRLCPKRMLCFNRRPMAKPRLWTGFRSSWRAMSGHGQIAALALNFWSSLATNSGGLRRIICGMAFMNYAPNKGMSNIGCSIFSTGDRLPSSHTP